MGYDMVSRLVDVAEVKDMVASQTVRIGTYLAAHSYYLVRPCGGFSVAGASGALQGMEHPFGRVFTRSTGSPHPSAANFPDAMRRAGVWDGLAGPYAEGTVAGPLIGAPAVAALLAPVLGPAALPLVAALLPTLLVAAGQAAAIYDNRAVFDVLWDASTPNRNDPAMDAYGDASATEFAAAHLLSALPPKERFELLLTALVDTTSWAAGFVPYMGLTGLDDDDPTVREAYLSWLSQRQKPPVPVSRVLDGAGDPWLFPGAVGCLLGGVPAAIVHVGTPEGYLAAALQDQVVAQRKFHDNLAVLPGGDRGGSWEMPLAALDTMTAIALALATWAATLRRREADRRALVPPVPSAAQLNAMPAPRIPASLGSEWMPPEVVLQAALPLVVEPATADEPAGMNLLKDAPLPHRSAVPPAVTADRGPLQLLVSQQFDVPESSEGVEVAHVLKHGDQYEISATGSVWSGIFAEPPHGPIGRDDITHNRTFPLWGTPDAHPFALVGRLGPYGEYFFVGDGLDRRTYLGDDQGPLVLRVNDATTPPATGPAPSSAR